MAQLCIVHDKKNSTIFGRMNLYIGLFYLFPQKSADDPTAFCFNKRKKIQTGPGKIKKPDVCER